jgi:hypothetical protein
VKQVDFGDGRVGVDGETARGYAPNVICFWCAPLIAGQREGAFPSGGPLIWATLPERVATPQAS